MPYLIDGHNLIPKVPGLSLENIDDEKQLIELLILYCRIRRRVVEVFFDKAPAGYPRSRSFGALTAHFVREGQTADDAIRSRLRQLGQQARNWIVVSSDQSVQSAARAAHAHFISSETFAQELIRVGKPTKEPDRRPETQMSEEELARWLDIFTSKPTEE